MTNQMGQEAYLNSAIMTASPEELTLMLYDGAVKFNNQAMLAVDTNNIEESNRLIGKVQDIVNELHATLNMEVEVSKNLEMMYDYIYRRLVEANVKKDKEILVEVHEYLKELRDTWKEAMVLAKKKVANS
ncbi:MAG: flagellar export chaperone FliS [Clostridia bacterium]|jgi:flagellar protein FliS|nr:flagellar export chaperone FliS [Clostridia bacterium]